MDIGNIIKIIFNFFVKGIFGYVIFIAFFSLFGGYLGFVIYHINFTFYYLFQSWLETTTINILVLIFIVGIVKKMYDKFKSFFSV